MSRAFSIGAMWLVWAWAMPAYAYEDQASIDGELGYGHAVSDVAPAHGIALGLGASYGLSNLFTVRGQFSWALHPGDPSMLSVLLLSAEVLYVIDVLEIVPFFGAGIDAVGFSGDAYHADFGVHPVLGFDWLVSREWTIGLQLRPVFLLTALDSEPVYFKLGVTVSYLLDLF